MDDTNQGNLRQAAQQVFSSMLGLELIPVNGTEPPEFQSGRRVSSSVGISGDFNGAVLIECGTNTACQLAGMMMGSEPSEGLDAIVKDVIGELTNMVAGSFKRHLPGHSFLTLPCFIEGSDYVMDIVQGKRIISEILLLEGQGIVFSLVQANGRF